MKSSALHHHFDTLEQQRDAARLGLWLFLATEFLFFGGLFMAFAVYHLLYPQEFAFAGRQTNLVCGSINSGLLLTSGLTMALAVNAIQFGAPKASSMWILVTIVLGAAFLGVKGLEYAGDLHEHLVPGPKFAHPGHNGAQIFFWLYWAMTGLHAVHLIVGIGFLGVIFWMTRQDRFSREYFTPLEMCGLYWGFVDVIWIFLYPLLYLIDRKP